MSDAAEQARQLARVAERIDGKVLAFCRARVTAGRPEFHLADLESAVPDCTPGSPGRILRELRRKRSLDYEVVSRAASLYRLTAVENPSPVAPAPVFEGSQAVMFPALARAGGVGRDR